MSWCFIHWNLLLTSYWMPFNVYFRHLWNNYFFLKLQIKNKFNLPLFFSYIMMLIHWRGTRWGKEDIFIVSRNRVALLEREKEEGKRLRIILLRKNIHAGGGVLKVLPTLPQMFTTACMNHIHHSNHSASSVHKVRVTIRIQDYLTRKENVCENYWLGSVGILYIIWF